MGRRPIAIIAAAACFALFGCTPSNQPEPDPTNNVPSDVPDAAPALAAIATAITEKDITKVPMVRAAADAQEEFETVFAGMDEIYPEITPGDIVYGEDGRSATATLHASLAVTKEPWTYDTTASLKLVDDQWRLDWAPSVLNPDVTSDSRLRRTSSLSRRGAINDKDGLALVEERAMFEVGLDKGAVDADDWMDAAEDLATVMDIDVKDYQKKVEAGGERQFVIAATVSQDQVSPQVSEIPGVHVNEIATVTGPSKTFATGLLGTIGHPTSEMIEKSDGTLNATDVVGLSGLQARYEEQLGGAPGVVVTLVERKDRTTEGEFNERVLFQQDPSVGSPIDTSLDRELQTDAEKVLAKQKGIAALVVIDLATGGIAAAATSPEAGSYPHATFGKYAPGSTFKVVSALAMLRDGKTPSSTVQCPTTLQIPGHTFKNYDGYPSSKNGSITLTEAIAYSCNTVFTGAAEDITAEELHAAAGSLGVGTDYDAGFTSYFGTVEPDNDIDRAASMIGQGQVTMSPMGMAAVAASVASGKTVIPWLVKGHEAKSTADPLTEEEASALRTMMKATVDEGSGTSLQGVMTGAKSGTAEFGADPKNLDTHAWMIAFNDTYAVASFVEFGDSGGTTAAPLIKSLFD
ncbi:penicillin-binding transpeptidase domain-containing protein [Tessaracoccus caeni]|uniref:penicillin-binding transpeptidase domain-containing protein n=1 Tax=Tessaracoccus caeni TaxID=3031239 RepID=UPI0023D9EABB|nr:penicillin-binding transpeptidase domain-containing protein [Tessaracoccus caeni]MDF1488162.1 penicillin-binding transpeptidase domain-containing protein [Tessaracoccus caeni]